MIAVLLKHKYPFILFFLLIGKELHSIFERVKACIQMIQVE